MGPSTWTQVAIIALFVLPGFVCRGVRARLRGPHPDDRELPVRIFRALAVSVAFALIYILVLGVPATGVIRDPNALLNSPRGYASAALVLIFVIPAGVGVLTHAWYLSRSGVVDRWWKVGRSDLALYDNTPTAWDYGFRHRDELQFIRVLTSDNLWIGGLANSQAFATAYPERREIYLPVAFEMNDDGSFGDQVENTAGIWINCEDAKVVQFVHAAEAETGGDEPTEVAHTGSEDGDGDDGTIDQAEG